MSDTPDYDAYQSSFHEAFRAELYGIVDALPVGGRALDVPCGNGFYSRRLVEHFRGRLTAVDSNDEYLQSTRNAVGVGAEVLKADAYQLPFGRATFDLIWCAQSLISLDPERAVREMFRVVKPGGVVAILEVDEFHRVLLPWPVELEAALPLAVRAATEQEYGDAVKMSPARRLRGVLKEAGFKSVRRVTYPFDRTAPFDSSTAAFLTHHFGYLRSFVRSHLPRDLQKVFDRVTSPDSDDSLYREDVELVCLNAVYLARPSGTASPVAT
ncbi:methyltransferase domain-containing protein [Gemmata sp. JC717]|uniref:class I SAM-dependent methyltransferase n=1 Tax=Gemmata algarum TaxID=2975278 RepID=UPI0021BB0160|nr:methyltransferase domain-containing protein [Gemmata algarum]MDY3552966.1 methyltransferase domain-containing protein [Gemmata algarum]